MPGLNFVSTVFRVSAVVILSLAAWQVLDWWSDRPPGDVGLSVLVADSIRLIVVSALLWAASNLASILIRSHYDLRASRILLSRQTYVLRQMAIQSGAVSEDGKVSDRRSGSTDEIPIEEG
ncbi:MAG: hypothetical protein H0X64_11660 [Gemmatimonadaceae bacterium]|nr:hypothetical protein [Gemmatimonadaceae bacterium]